MEYVAVEGVGSDRLRRRAFELLEEAADGDAASRFFDVAIITLIVANVAALVLQTVPSIGQRFGPWFFGFELVSVAIFSVEYIARLWSCAVDGRYADRIRGRVRYAAKPMLIVDLLAILPFFLPFLGLDLRFLRAARMFRLFRMVKLARYSAALRAFGRVMDAKKEQLVIVTTVIGFLILVAASLIYFAEHSAQPEAFSSIPAAMWWAVATLSTVGYGDVVPVTALGKLCAAGVAVLGIGMFALPAGILGSGFVGELERADTAEEASQQTPTGASSTAGGNTCPHCGQTVT